VVIRGNQRGQHREALTSFSSLALRRMRFSRTPYANWLNLSSAIEPPLPYSHTQGALSHNQPQSATIREQSSTIREHSATISLNQGAIREQSATLTFAVQLDELVGHERGEALTKLAWLCLLIHIGLDLMREAIRAALRDEGRNQAQPSVMREAIREACWEAHLHTW
jgi:hypothetical protein